MLEGQQEIVFTSASASLPVVASSSFSAVGYRVPVHDKLLRRLRYKPRLYRLAMRTFRPVSEHD